jgi:hypothetical protein
MLKKLIRTLFSQRGAMFGMDARIALIVASVLAATGGITIMSRLDRSKVDAAERSLFLIRDAMLDYYQTIGITELPPTIDTLMEEGLLEDLSLEKDPWGNPWQYAQLTENVELEGTDIAMKYAIVFSAGKDGVIDSDIIQNENDFAQWAERNDDRGIKISTRDVELKRLEEYRARAQLIVDKITSMEAANYLEATGSCGSASPPNWCADYEGKNHTQFNYYPKSDLDQTDGVVYFTAAKGGTTAYIAGDLNDMRQLMEDVGLPTTYAIDPWNRVLFYHSNITKRENPPFTASICFSHGGNCL